MSEKDKQRLKEYQRSYRKAKKINIKTFYRCFFTYHKSGKKLLIFVKQCINENSFHKNKRSVNIDEVDTKRTV